MSWQRPNIGSRVNREVPARLLRPVKTGVFSRRQTCRGKSQKPCSLDGGMAGCPRSQGPEAHRQGLPWGDYELPGRNDSERKCGLVSVSVVSRCNNLSHAIGLGGLVASPERIAEIRRNVCIFWPIVTSLSGGPSSASQLIVGLILLQSALRSSLVASALRRLSLFLLAAGCRQRSPQHFKNDGCGPAKQQHAVHCRHQPKQVPPLQRSHVAVAKRCGSLQRQSKQDQCQEIPMSEQANDQPSTSTRCEAIKTDAVALMTAVNRRD
jgi:hypothetical protein